MIEWVSDHYSVMSGKDMMQLCLSFNKQILEAESKAAGYGQALNYLCKPSMCSG